MCHTHPVHDHHQARLGSKISLAFPPALCLHKHMHTHTHTPAQGSAQQEKIKSLRCCINVHHCTCHVHLAFLPSPIYTHVCNMYTRLLQPGSAQFLNDHSCCAALPRAVSDAPLSTHDGLPCPPRHLRPQTRNGGLAEPNHHTVVVWVLNTALH